MVARNQHRAGVGSLVMKNISQKDLAALYLGHISSLILRLIGHSFSIISGIRSVAVSAYTQCGVFTGRIIDEYVAVVDVDGICFGHPWHGRLVTYGMGVHLQHDVGRRGPRGAFRSSASLAPPECIISFEAPQDPLLCNGLPQPCRIRAFFDHSGSYPHELK